MGLRRGDTSCGSENVPMCTTHFHWAESSSWFYIPSWASMSFELQSALKCIFSLPSLEICKIEDVLDLSADVFGAFTHLKKLSLDYVSVDHHPTDQSRISSPHIYSSTCSKLRVQLESLHLRGINSVDGREPFEVMEPYISISQLREVWVSPGNGFLWEAIKSACSTLETFTWTFSTKCNCLLFSLTVWQS